MRKFHINNKRARLLKRALFLQAVCRSQEPRSWSVRIEAVMMYTGGEKTGGDGPKRFRLYETMVEYVVRRDLFSVDLLEFDSLQRIYLDLDRLLENWILIAVFVDMVHIGSGAALSWGD